MSAQRNSAGVQANAGAKADTHAAANAITGATASRDEAILAAVSAGLRRYGPRKLTAQDVADASGISRMTFYRAMGSMDNAILLALTREFTAAVAAIRSSLPEAPGAERLAAFLGAGARAFVASELVSSVLQHQPGLLEPYLSGRLGRSQEVVLATIAELRDAGRADGSIADHAPSALTLLLLVRGVALGAPLLQGDADFERACTELSALVAAALAAGVANAGDDIGAGAPHTPRESVVPLS